MSECVVPIEFRKDGGGSEIREVGLSQAIHEVFSQTAEAVGTRLTNPLWNYLYQKTGENYAFTPIEKLSDRSCGMLR